MPSPPNPPAPSGRAGGAGARLAGLRLGASHTDAGGAVSGDAHRAAARPVLPPPGAAPLGGWVPESRRRHRTRPAERERSPRPDGERAPSGRTGMEPEAVAEIMDDGPGRARAHGADGTIGEAADGGDRPQPGWAARLVHRGPWGALSERWVPEPLRGARVDPGRRGAALLSVVAALAAVVAAVGVWWDRPEPRPVSPVALAPAATGDPAAPLFPAGGGSVAAGHPGGATSAAGGSAPGATPSATGPSPPPATTPAPVPTGPILVSVTGKVRHPGLVSVPPDARVADAIAAAGGALQPSDLTGLNLAAQLSDGDSVVVAGPGGSTLQSQTARRDGTAGGTPPPPGSSDAAGPVDLNTADQAALEQLPGVGPVTAAAIITWRTDHGPFTTVDQLQAVPGIGPVTYARIAPHVTV